MPLAEFGLLLDEFLASVPRSWLVLLTSPGIDEDRPTGSADRTDVVLDGYAAAARTRFEAAGGVVVNGRTLLADLGRGVRRRRAAP